jgi:hypothetical protein
VIVVPDACATDDERAFSPAWRGRSSRPCSAPAKKRREIDRALTVLQDAGHLRREIHQPERGPHAEVWIPVIGNAA